MPLQMPVKGEPAWEASSVPTPVPSIQPADRISVFLFGGALLLTLLGGKYFWAARIGWTLLAMLFAFRFEYAVLGVFFFMSFFQPSGFLPDFHFTIKHYHIAL